MEALFPDAYRLERRPCWRCAAEPDARRTRCLFRSAGRRDSWSRRAGRLGSHRAAARSSTAAGPGPVGRGARSPAAAYRPGRPDLAIRAGPRHRAGGAQVGGALAGLERGCPQYLDRRPQPVPARALHRSGRSSAATPPRHLTVTEHPARCSGAAGAAVLRRQPAEGGPGPLAACAPAGCCYSTNRRAVSTLAPRSEIYRVIAGLAARRDRGIADGFQRARRAARLLPPRAGAA